jgi:hypothetical protein
MAKTLSPEERNAERMHASLQQLGIHDINVDGLKAVLRNKPDPYSMGRWTMVDENKVKLQVKFDKAFSIDSYVATLVPKLPVNHAIINGVDTKALEERMKNADWYFTNSESAGQLESEYRKIEKVESEIDQLIKSPEGLRIATILWNNHVPFYTATKPELISGFEDSSELYVAQKFNKDITIEQAYSTLANAHDLNIRREGSLISSKQVPEILSPGITSEIIISNDHLVAIKELLNKMRQEGHEWIAFDEGRPILEKNDLNFFETHFDVSQFCHDNTTDRDFYNWMSIREFEIGVAKWEEIRKGTDVFMEFVDTKMKRADWNYKEADNYNRFYDGEKEIGQINYLLSLVKKVAGIEKANALWDQYASNAIPKPFFLTDKNVVMITEQELSQNRREFGLIGASEAFNEDLIKQMKAGVPKIEHKHLTKNSVTGDEAETTFYLNKKEKSNLYYLNNWETTAKKFGTDEPVKKMFFNNDLKRIGHVLKDRNKLVTTFTHTRSINYLCGRPVLNTYKNQNGRIKKVWDQAFPKDKLPNGKMKERQFHEEYGFNLKTTADEYRRAMKCLSNPEHAERFYQSLERGNFEKTIFVERDGKENPYYVIPNISVGFLEVYTHSSKDAEPLTPEQLAEKGFISKEFAHKVRERMNQIEKDKQTQKQEKVSENTSEENRTNLKNQKQGKNVSQKNKQNEKLNGETGKPKRKLKNKIS